MSEDLDEDKFEMEDIPDEDKSEMEDIPDEEVVTETGELAPDTEVAVTSTEALTSDQDSGASEQDAEAPQDQEAAARAAAEAKEDEVKPVFYIALFVLGMGALGIFDLSINLIQNQCQMTYMYEWPEYINISMSQHIQETYPMYKLYAYGEGALVQPIKDNEFSGIPVLFIPGNGGSYKQVRSLASVALRKAIEDSDYELHFDYFSIDFNEEQSAVYGGVLKQQAEFSRAAVDQILSLYPRNKNHPTSVVIVGHSMGGMVAKSLFLDPKFKASNVQLILNLATPVSPVFTMDVETAQFYKEVDNMWQTADRPAHVVMASIAGGERDFQVRSGLTIDSQADLSLSTTDSASVWVSADHRCIVWCKQLVLSINRALFDMVSKSSKQLTTDHKVMQQILNYHLVHRSGGKSFKKGKLHTKPVKFLSNQTSWISVTKKQAVVTRLGNDNSKLVQNHMIALPKSGKYDVVLDAVQMDQDNWLYGCTSVQPDESGDGTVCNEYINLSGESRIIPSRGKRKLYQTSVKDLKDKRISHIFSSTSDEAETSRINLDIYSVKERSLNFSVPSWIMFFKPHTILAKTAPGIIFYNISLVGFQHPYQAFIIHADPVTCKTKSQDPEGAHYGLARFVTPWANDTTQTLLVANDGNFTNMLAAKLMTSKPPSDTRLPQVHLYLDPECQYSVSLRPSAPSLMGQVLRYYAPLLPAYLTAATLLTIGQQLRRMDRDPECQSVLMAILTNVSPISVVLPSKMLAYVLAQPAVAKFLPETDYLHLQEQGLDFGVLPIMLMFMSIGILLVTSVALHGAVIGVGSLAHKAVVAYLARRTPTETLAEVSVSTVLTHYPSILAAFMIAAALGSCGAVSCLIAVAGCFIKLFIMYEDYLQSKVKKALGLEEEDVTLSEINKLTGISLLVLLSFLFSIPTLLTWIHRFQVISPPLPTDPTLVPGIVLALCLPLLWRDLGEDVRADQEPDATPAPRGVLGSRFARILQFLGILCLAFGQVNLYRVPYFMSAAFCVIAAHNFYVSKFGRENQTD